MIGRVLRFALITASIMKTIVEKEGNMDEMKIKLSSGLMKGIVSKLITKVIFKKCDVKPDIELNGISLEKVGSKIHIHINADAEIDESDLLKITRLSEMEEA